MPRLFHRPPKYRLHKSTKQAVVSYFGKQVYLGPFGSPRSHERYQQLLKDWERARFKQTPEAVDSHKCEDAINKSLLASVTAASLRTKKQSGSVVTITELIFVYRRHTHEYYRKRDEVTREAGAIDDALRVLRRYYGRSNSESFGPVALDALREAIIDELDWCRKYINKQINRIRGMFKWAASKEIIDPKVPAALRELSGLKKGRSRARESNAVRPVDDSVVDATILGLPDVVADMVRVQRLTSARPGEICSMAPADIDRSGDVWIYRPVENKTEHFEKDRVIAIGPRAQVIIGPYIVDRPGDVYCFSPLESEARRRAVATSRRTTPLKSGNRPGTNRSLAPRRTASLRYTTASYRRAIHRVCGKLKIEKWSPNRLRHTASTEIRRVFGIDAARAVDGHGTTSTTEIYAERDLNTAIEVMRAIG